MSMAAGAGRSAGDLLIYADGGCIGNPGPGGWGAVLVRGAHYLEMGGSEAQTTNNRMEMRAALEGLRRACAGERVHVVTDSRYLHDGMSKWLAGWKRRQWRRADGQPVLNRDLWEALDRVCTAHRAPVTWEHVRGHAGHALNERCDAIANGFARGSPPPLREGDGSWIPGLREADVPAPDVAFPAYLSLVEGELRLHLDWPDCDAWVRGAKGARYKKVRSGAELQAILSGWGVPEDQAARVLGRRP